MTRPLPVPSPRPRVVDIAFWCFMVGAVVVIVGGLMAATVSYDVARASLPTSIGDDEVRSYLTIYRATGIGSAMAAAALAFLAGRARRGDARFRSATLGLAFALVVVVGLLAIGAGVAQPLILLGLLPVLVGTALIVQPSARSWYDSQGLQ